MNDRMPGVVLYSVYHCDEAGCQELYCIPVYHCDEAGCLKLYCTTVLKQDMVNESQTGGGFGKNEDEQ